MLLPMLKAISKMLEYKSPNTASEAEVERPFMIKVGCAKVILDEIIQNLETKDIVSPKEGVIPVFKKESPAPNQRLVPKENLEPQPEVVTNGDEWFITLDENKNLIIEGFPADGLVELDGKKMKYSETRGIKFTKARIL